MRKLQTILKATKPHKTIYIKGSTVEIPMIGLRHLSVLKSVTEVDLPDKIVEYVRMFKDDATWAEAEYILFHVEHFNRKLEDVIEIDGEVFSMENVYISAQTEFETHEGIYKFREPKIFEEFNDPYDMLSKTLVESPRAIDDWGSEPAYVLSWADNILKTITLIGSKGTTYNDGAIITGLFINDKSRQK